MESATPVACFSSPVLSDLSILEKGCDGCIRQRQNKREETEAERWGQENGLFMFLPPFFCLNPIPKSALRGCVHQRVGMDSGLIPNTPFRRLLNDEARQRGCL